MVPDSPVIRPLTHDEAQKAASDYFNALPREERVKLSPLLEHYRLMGYRDALTILAGARIGLQSRIGTIEGRLYQPELPEAADV